MYAEVLTTWCSFLVCKIWQTLFYFEAEGNNISNATHIYGNYFPKFVSLDYNLIKLQWPVTITVACHIPARKQAFLGYIFHNESHRQQVDFFLRNNLWHYNASVCWTSKCEPQGVRNILVCMEWVVLGDMVCDSPLEAQGLTPKEACNISGKCYFMKGCLDDVITLWPRQSGQYFANGISNLFSWIQIYKFRL